MIMTLGVLLLLAAISTDVGHAFNAKRHATNVASAAARSGADAVDTDSLYSSGVAEVNMGRAGTAINNAMPSGVALHHWTFHHGQQEISVNVKVVHDTLLLKMIGINQIVVHGESTARVQNGAG